MKTFKDLEFKPHATGMGGVMSRITFENGYGASVVQTFFSYGGEEGLYELAVLDSNGDLTYSTPITNDVLGHLSEDDVTKVLEQIQNLK
jgi:hypothetical protein